MYGLNTTQLVTAVVLSIFIVIRPKLGASLTDLLSTLSGKVVLVGIVAYLFYEHVILGVLGMIVVYEMIQQTSKTVAPTLVMQETPLPNDESMMLSSFQQFPPTLEETIVNNAVPLIQNQSPPHLHFKPNTQDVHGAATL